MFHVEHYPKPSLNMWQQKKSRSKAYMIPNIIVILINSKVVNITDFKF